ncbi:CT620/CT621 family type III secretion system effector [Chlamydia psittaci]|uniref:Effector from type III secretion system family protein n=1 Tax=Chlamydia psittaci 99DC5 TaxID=1112251 RepID=A0ABP2X3M4_CHLPS|nr:CT620/CT621 family type III secretion system effector [Chlamydia psittaci]EPJ28229.1 effector from type III secretion system family protein [Chlamydia psittaci 99DC5]
MTIQPSYITFNRNVTAALLGDQVDMTTPFSSAVFLFQELDQKARGLKHALGLLQETESQFPVPEMSSGFVEDIAFDNFSDGKIALPKVASDSTTVEGILQNPNLAAAKVYIEGLEKNFEDWVKPVDEGGLFNSTEAEKAIVREYQVKLSTLKQAFTTGNPTEEQYNSLYALSKEFVAAIEKLEGKEAPPKSKVIHFWQNMMVVYNAMVSLAYPVSEELNVKLAICSLNIDEANKIIELMRQFASSLKDLLNPAWDVSSDASGLSGSGYNAMQGGMTRSYLVLGGVYRMLMEKYADSVTDPMPQEIKSGIATFIKSMKIMNINDHVTFVNFLSLQYAYLACVGQYGVNSSSQISDYRNALTQEKNYWGERVVPDFDISQAPMSNFVSNPQADYQGIKLFNNGTNNLNPEFFQNCIELMTKSPIEASRSDYQRVVDAMNAGIKQIQVQINQWTQESTKLMAQKASMDPTQLNYFKSMSEGKDIFVKTAPIQMVYSSLLLDKYLPNQQQVLETLGVQMTFSNKAAKYMNQIIHHVTNFQTADVYYSLAIYLRQMNLQALTDAKGKAESVLSKEKIRCQSDIARCQRAKGELTQILESINGDRELTASQAQELRQTISGYQFQFDALIRNLGNLSIFLNNMQFQPVDNPNDIDKAFKILVNSKESEDWPRFLASFESFVIEGGENGVVPGGEQQILQSLEAAQLNFTTFNQNQQLALQLESSAIQQEWTMVSAALALMNQIFAKLTRRLK